MNTITIPLTSAEALVLFEFLSKLLETDHPELFSHASEEIVLNNILGTLESTLTEPFSPDYAELLSKARNSI